MSYHQMQSPSFDLTWRPERGVFRLESPGRLIEAGPGLEFVRQNRVRTIATAELPVGRAQVNRLQDVHGEAQELRVDYQELSGLALSLRVRLYSGRPFALLRLSVANVGPGSVKLRRLFIETTSEGIRTPSEPAGAYVNGWQSWSRSGFYPVGDRPYASSLPERWLQGPMVHNAGTPRTRHTDRFWSEMCGALVTAREALIGGIASTADQFGQVWLDLRPGHQQMMLQTQLDDVRLAVGESRQSEWYYLEWVPLPNLDPFAQYAHAVARQMSVHVSNERPTGWCSWYMYWNQVSEASVVENLASAALVADEIPLDVLQLDDGYQEAWGDWTTRNERFPHSLDWLAARMRGSGFRPGLWIAPLIVERSSRVARTHPDWLLRGRRGRPVRAGLVSDFVGRALDASHPEVVAYIRDVVRTVVHDWGYNYLKLDFLYAGALEGRRHDPQMTRAQALRQVLAAIREEAGPETFLVGCGAPLGPSIGVVDAMRIGADTAPNWAPDFGILTRFVTRNPAVPSLRNSLANVATRAWMHGRLWINDPDVLMMRDTQTQLNDNEVLTQTTLLGLTGGLTFLSDDLDNISPARRALAAVLFPPLLDGVDFLDLLESGMPELAMVPVACSWGRWRLVALFNWSEEEVERELPEAVALDERKTYHIVHFWEQRYFLMGPGALRPVLHIPPHGVVLLGVRTSKRRPHVVGTTFHISQGREIKDCRILSESSVMILSVDIQRVAKGAIWLALPGRPTEVTLDGVDLPDKVVRAVASGVWSITCRIAGSAELRVSWARSPAAKELDT